MKLLLDEMYSPEIARRLRDRGHDVISVKERPDLVARRDTQLIAAMAAEGRIIVTEDVAHFVPLANQLAAEGTDHGGLLLTSDRSLPRSRDTIGLFVGSIDRLLRDASAGSTMRNEVTWLTPTR